MRLSNLGEATAGRRKGTSVWRGCGTRQGILKGGWKEGGNRGRRGKKVAVAQARQPLRACHGVRVGRVISDKNRRDLFFFFFFKVQAL